MSSKNAEAWKLAAILNIVPLLFIALAALYSFLLGKINKNAFGQPWDEMNSMVGMLASLITFMVFFVLFFDSIFFKKWKLKIEQAQKATNSNYLEVREIKVTHCGDCPACNGEFELCQIDADVKTAYHKIPENCPLKNAEYILKI